MFKEETGEIVPAIVTEELWDKANKVLARRSEDVKNRQGICNHANLLTGKLYCTQCGQPTTAASQRTSMATSTPNGSAPVRSTMAQIHIRPFRSMNWKSSRSYLMYSAKHGLTWKRSLRNTRRCASTSKPTTNSQSGLPSRSR